MQYLPDLLQIINLIFHSPSFIRARQHLRVDTVKSSIVNTQVVKL